MDEFIRDAPLRAEGISTGDAELAIEVIRVLRAEGPLGRLAEYREFIDMDPRIQDGHPVVSGRRIETDMLAKLSEWGRSPDELADRFDLATQAVEAALALRAGARGIDERRCAYSSTKICGATPPSSSPSSATPLSIRSRSPAVEQAIWKSRSESPNTTHSSPPTFIANRKSGARSTRRLSPAQTSYGSDIGGASQITQWLRIARSSGNGRPFKLPSETTKSDSSRSLDRGTVSAQTADLSSLRGWPTIHRTG